jgi:stage II sporulation protein D
MTFVAAARQPMPLFVVSGHGWGHGVGMGQYGAYGYAKHGLGYRSILAHYYPGTTIGTAPVRRVRVLLAQRKTKLTISSTADFTVTDATGKTHDVAAGSATFDSNLKLKVDAAAKAKALPGPLLFGPGAAPLELGRPYRGQIQVAAAGTKLQAVDVVGLEPYLQGVVPAEMPHTWAPEALKAQAVAARTYAITSRAGSISDGFDQYADTRSQMYKGVAAERPTTDAAVAATAGQIVTYGGQPVTTFFFSTSGGKTENVENSFVGSAPKPWLKGVDDPYDDLAPRHRWKPLTLTAAQVNAKLRGLVKGRFEGIKVIQRGVSPRIVRAQVVGTRGTTPVTGPQLRSRFGLFDTWAYFTTVTSTGKRAPLAPETPTTPVAPAPAITPAGGVAPSAASGPTGGTAGGGTASAASVRRHVARPTGPVLSGRISPAKPGARIRVERRVGRRWVLAVDAPLAADGRYAVAVPGAGVYRVRYAKDVVGPDVRVR